MTTDTRGEHLADGGFDAGRIGHPCPDLIAACHAEWPGTAPIATDAHAGLSVAVAGVSLPLARLRLTPAATIAPAVGATTAGALTARHCDTCRWWDAPRWNIGAGACHVAESVELGDPPPMWPDSDSGQTNWLFVRADHYCAAWEAKP